MSACSIRVFTRAFEWIWRIVRKVNSVKFFVFIERGIVGAKYRPLSATIYA